ncbi:MAG: ABC transporter permease [Gaiellaceae bacterium]
MTADAQSLAAQAVPGELAARAALPPWLGVLAMPVFLTAVCVGLYLYVSRQELDAIETRLLEGQYVRERLIEHITLASLATVLMIAIAVPLGILLTRPLLRRLTPLFIGLANIGQAIPAIGLVIIFPVVWSQIGFRPMLYALIIHSALQVLRNTMVGLDQVDRALIDAGRGMGMSKLRVLMRIELPLAVPVILAGVRTALVLNVGVATLGTFINAGTLGDVIDNGVGLNREPVIITGAVLTAVLALTTDWVAGIAERILRPKGL